MVKAAKRIGSNIKRSVREKWKSATLDFLVIIAFVNAFQWVFGAENSIIGVIFTIMMGCSMARDMTAAPLSHFSRQLVVMTVMTVTAACVTALPPLWALLPNALMLFVILYAYTYEYRNDLYFPYILSYLFMLFITPVPFAGLPKRLSGVAVGCVCVLLYHLVKNRRHAARTIVAAVTAMLDEGERLLDAAAAGLPRPDGAAAVRASVRKVSALVYERRKRFLKANEALLSALDAARGIEHLYLLLEVLPVDAHVTCPGALRSTREYLDRARAFLTAGAPLGTLDALAFFENEAAAELGDALLFVQRKLTAMTGKQLRKRFPPSRQPLRLRLKAAVNFSPVRFFYALRVTLLLAAGTLLVRMLDLEHGKWLLFTLASVSLPYADDVGKKAAKRLIATLVGGSIGAMLFWLLPWGGARTAVMMLSGYVSYYFSGYTGSYACSTVGALGGAVFITSFGAAPVFTMLGIRVGYIVAGIVVAYAANRLLFPFKRQRASRQLWLRYAGLTRRLSALSQQAGDVQLYYSLVVASNQIEEKLLKNASAAGKDRLWPLIARYRSRVRAAHRRRTVCGRVSA